MPTSDISAMTLKRFFGYWVRHAHPFLSVLPGDLQDVFIAPQVRELEALGVDIRHGPEVTGVRGHDGAVASVRWRDGSEVSGDVFARRTPFEGTRTWVKDALSTFDPALGSLPWLEAQPMAAWHLRRRHRSPHLPQEHVFLHRSHDSLACREYRKHTISRTSSTCCTHCARAVGRPRLSHTSMRSRGLLSRRGFWDTITVIELDRRISLLGSTTSSAFSPRC